MAHRVRAHGLLEQRPPKLQREERIAAGGLVEADQRWARRTDSQARAEQLVDSSQVERSQAQPLRWQPDLERSRWWLATREADGGEHADGLCHQTAERKGEHRRRGLIEPLGIVDRNQQRTRPGQGAQHIQQGEPDGTLIRWLLLGLGQ